MDPKDACRLHISEDSIGKILDPIREERMFVPELRRMEKGLSEMNRKFKALKETYADAFQRTKKMDEMLAHYRENWS